MSGKWSGLKGQVPLAPVELGWQQKVNEVKTVGKIGPNGNVVQPALNLLSKTDKARKYCELRDKKDELEAQISELNIDLEALSQLMIQEMEQEGSDSFRLASGDSVSIKDEPYSSVADKVAFKTWIAETNQEDLLTVNYMTMNSIVKQRLEQGLSAPPGIKVFLKQSITRRRGRK